MYAIQYVKSKKQKMRQLSTPDVRPTYAMLKRKYGRANGQARQRPSSVEQGLSEYAFRGEIGYGYTPMRCI